MYRAALPLPNPDLHEVIGAAIDLAPSKVFFGINLIREKMSLPKLEYPKRKLAVTPEQLAAIETLYNSYLPLPPVGVHKIISKQLKIDEWRVHVAIGLVRKNWNMPRWNEERDDIPDAMKEPKGKKPHPDGGEGEKKAPPPDPKPEKPAKASKAEKPEKPEKPAAEAEETAAEAPAEPKPAKKPGRPKKVVEVKPSEDSDDEGDTAAG